MNKQSLLEVSLVCSHFVLVAVAVCQRPLAVLGMPISGKDGGMRRIVCLLHPSRGILDRVGVVPRSDCRIQVDVKGEDVEGEYEGDDPLDNSRCVMVAPEVNHAEGNR